VGVYIGRAVVHLRFEIPLPAEQRLDRQPKSKSKIMGRELHLQAHSPSRQRLCESTSQASHSTHSQKHGVIMYKFENLELPSMPMPTLKGER
jgi:hypothetical protein